MSVCGIMKWISIVCLFLGMSVQAQPIAVVELFTSQGCSSCPSADKLLQEVVGNKSEKGRVIGLSFHVEYWNRLGWKDPYSDQKYTDRQRWYAREMRLSSMYTPQMIVDGREEFVGSNRSRLKSAVLKSFENEKESIMISNLKVESGQVTFKFDCFEGNHDVINFAIVQKQASNYVPRGENRSRTLTHSNVVRYFQSIPFQKSSYMTLPLPDTDEDLMLIIYTQDTSTLALEAVSEVKL
ncbi:DUF1223 domain-containing protein [Reichenbachiella versicolor]|uniref:DUF1223 domain-containing protein n=1 Tax=Reichenbachiella versicolor TaxID=1821036 RepID=UPI000D6DFBF9|nr:DUF1223 domain-containing protein [Reichenbachiella versicolor]